MKRTASPFGFALLLVWVLNPGSAYGDRGPDSSGYPKINKLNYPQPERGSKPDRRERGQNRRPTRDDPRQVAKEITRLQQAMKERLKLSGEQGKAIDQLFEEHLQLLGTPGGARKSGGKDVAAADEVRELRERMAAAREAGNTEAVNEIRKQLRQLKTGRGGSTEDATSQFLRAVGEKLTEEQTKDYQRILKRLKLDRFGEKPGTALRNLMRAAMHPSVKLSEEQKQKIRGLSREVFQSAGKGAGREGRNAEMLDQIAEDLKVKIFAELTDEQRATVEQLLKSDLSRRGKGADRPRKGGDRSRKGGDRPGRP